MELKLNSQVPNDENGFETVIGNNFQSEIGFQPVYKGFNPCTRAKFKSKELSSKTSPKLS